MAEPIRPPYAIPTTDQRDPSDVQAVTGTVTIEGDVETHVDFPSTIGITNFPATQAVSGTVAVSNHPAPPDVTSLATEATLDAARDGIVNRYSGGKTPVVASVTASGDTTIHDPAAGKAIRLFWITALNDPDDAATPLIKVGFGPAASIDTELYRTYALAHWEVFEGAVDERLIVNLSAAANVAVTVHLQEF